LNYIACCYDVALALYALGAPEGVRIHLCVYHANYPLLLRSAVERRLDQALDRRKPDAVFGLPDIRQRLDGSVERDQLFIVLGSPVTEVGRDHDYDWAVAEPSSMRSLIQLAGRIRRHRDTVCESPNMLIFESNLRHAERPGEPAFCKPGFEDTEHRLHSHNLHTLLRAHECDVIDARPRIVARPPADQQPDSSLVDLEHHRLQRALLAPAAAPPLSARRQRATKQPSAPPIGAYSWWHLPGVDAQLTGALPQYQPFRADDGPRMMLCLLPDDDGDWKLHEVVTEGRHQVHHVLVEAELLVRLDDATVCGRGIAPWGDTDFRQALVQLADELDISPATCALRYGTVSLPASALGWRFHAALGFGRRR
jgi:CRISPR-associated endonuclease/helicase Cas3